MSLYHSSLEIYKSSVLWILLHRAVRAFQSEKELVSFFCLFSSFFLSDLNLIFKICDFPKWHTCLRWWVCLGRLSKWRVRKPASSVDYSLCSVVSGSGTRTQNDNGFACPGLSRSVRKEVVLSNDHDDVRNYRLLTGSSSFPFQTPVTCLCCITCLIFKSVGNAVHPALMLQQNTTNFLYQLAHRLIYLKATDVPHWKRAVHA